MSKFAIMGREKKILSKGMCLISLVLGLFISLMSAAPLWASPLSEVKELLQYIYVDQVEDSVLQEDSIEAALKKLGDPHTVYFTAEEYQNFIDSVDMTFSGIGVYFEMVPRGVRVTRVFPGSPSAGAGIQPGDIVIKADEQSLADSTSERAVELLRGPTGSPVELRVLRGEEEFTVTVKRRPIEVPSVTGEVINGHVGYIIIESFAKGTPELFEKTVSDLRRKNVDSWILDIRSNPGGYLETALSIAGNFIGERPAVLTKYRDTTKIDLLAYKRDVIIKEPIILLTDEHSASSAEILAALLKDYSKALIIGNKTYGKGSVQTMFPLSDGSVLKMTVAKFFSPYGKEINKVGVSPDLQIIKTDPMRSAELLLGDGQDSAKGTLNQVRVTIAGVPWLINLAKARDPLYWPAYSELLQSLKSPGDLRLNDGTNYEVFSEEDWERKWPLYYPKYRELKALEGIPLNKTFTVKFSRPILWDSVSKENIELIEAESGVRLPLIFEAGDEQTLRVTPQELLKPGKTYWLLLHSGIQDINKGYLAAGSIAVAKTTEDAATLKMQSYSELAGASQWAPYGPTDLRGIWSERDYGQTIVEQER